MLVYVDCVINDSPIMQSLTAQAIARYVGIEAGCIGALVMGVRNTLDTAKRHVHIYKAQQVE